MGSCYAISIGLHRDPSHWKLDPKTVERRRRLFWEINTSEKWRVCIYFLQVIDLEINMPFSSA